MTIHANEHARLLAENDQLEARFTEQWAGRTSVEQQAAIQIARNMATTGSSAVMRSIGQAALLSIARAGLSRVAAVLNERGR